MVSIHLPAGGGTHIEFDKKGWRHRGWVREFHDPIALPDGGALVTFLDADYNIIGLSEHAHTAAEW